MPSLLCQTLIPWTIEDTRTSERHSQTMSGSLAADRMKDRFLWTVLSLSSLSISLNGVLFRSATGTGLARPNTPFELARYLSFLTMIYHDVVILFSPFRPKDASNSDPLIGSPAICMAACLALAWFVMMWNMMTYSIVCFSDEDGWRWKVFDLWRRCRHGYSVLAMLEVGVLVYLVVRCLRARRIHLNS
jgi:hypothetical protein